MMNWTEIILLVLHSVLAKWFFIMKFDLPNPNVIAVKHEVTKLIHLQRASDLQQPCILKCFLH
jgi:hypothetical protein